MTRTGTVKLVDEQNNIISSYHQRHLDDLCYYNSPKSTTTTQSV